MSEELKVVFNSYEKCVKSIEVKFNRSHWLQIPVCQVEGCRPGSLQVELERQKGLEHQAPANEAERCASQAAKG